MLSDTQKLYFMDSSQAGRPEPSAEGDARFSTLPDSEGRTATSFRDGFTRIATAFQETHAIADFAVHITDLTLRHDALLVENTELQRQNKTLRDAIDCIQAKVALVRLRLIDANVDLGFCALQMEQQKIGIRRRMEDIEIELTQHETRIGSSQTTGRQSLEVDEITHDLWLRVQQEIHAQAECMKTDANARIGRMVQDSGRQILEHLAAMISGLRGGTGSSE